MNCQDLQNRLDDFLDGALDEAAVQEIERHLDACPACRERLAQTQRLRDALRALPVSGPSPGFYDRALQHAMAHETEAHRHRWYRGAALAAGVALVVGGLLWQRPIPDARMESNAEQVAVTKRPQTMAAAEIPGLSIQLNETRDVKLVINSPTTLAQATFTVVLPPGVELKGYPNRREITWEGNLKPGKNLLVLPVIARAPGGGELVASISHGDKRKVFRVRMEIAAQQQSSSTPFLRMDAGLT